jgi:hypothetical protein
MVAFPAKSQRYSKLHAKGRHLCHVPRYANLISELPAERFDRLTSVAAIYWECYMWVAEGEEPGTATIANAEETRIATGLLDDCLRLGEIKWLGLKERRSPNLARNLDNRQDQVRLALDMLGAIAFEMRWPGKSPVVKQNEDGTWPRIPFPSQEKEDRWFVENDQAFQNAVFDRMVDAGAYYLGHRGYLINDPEYWNEDWARLAGMNSAGMKYLVFNDASKRIQFKDVTTRDFFAAAWALRRSNDNDLRRLASCYTNIGRDNYEYNQFWTFVVDLNHLVENTAGSNSIIPVAGDRTSKIFGPLYNKELGLVDNHVRPIRVTELIYRTWALQACGALQSIYQEEFKDILNGKLGDFKKALARTLLNNMQLLCIGNAWPTRQWSLSLGRSSGVVCRENRQSILFE